MDEEDGGEGEGEGGEGDGWPCLGTAIFCRWWLPPGDHCDCDGGG